LNDSNPVNQTDAPQSEQLAENVRQIRQEITEACERADRDPEEVQICAVTKNRPIDAIEALNDEGLTYIGENRVQEAERKFRFLPDDCRMDLVGHLQSNKTSLAVQLFNGMQSVDRLKIVDYLQRHCEKRDLHLPVFLQVNASGETSKFGVPPEDVKPVLDELMEAEALDVRGFMTMAPYVDDPEEVRPIFSRLREMRDRYSDEYGEEAPVELSMGMTQDYPVAVEEGSTVVRIGRGFFDGTEWE
jgi:pyridoxal phosphate enzyme (YggS family)